MGAVPLTLESVGWNPGQVPMYGTESSRWVVAAMLISVILLGIPLRECGVRDTNRRMGTKIALSESRGKDLNAKSVACCCRRPTRSPEIPHKINSCIVSTVPASYMYCQQHAYIYVQLVICAFVPCRVDSHGRPVSPGFHLALIDRDACGRATSQTSGVHIMRQACFLKHTRYSRFAAISGEEVIT